MKKVFFMQNNPILAYLKPELKRRLDQWVEVETFIALFQKELFSVISSDQCTLKIVSRFFGMSPLSLQIKLTVGQTTFNEHVQLAKRELAVCYLQETVLPTIDVAYLLSYIETSSFVRAFKTWTGKTISEVKKLY